MLRPFLRPVLLSLALGASLGLSGCETIGSWFGSNDAAKDAKDARLDGECVRQEVDKAYRELTPGSVATPLFLRAPFDKMRP